MSMLYRRCAPLVRLAQRAQGAWIQQQQQQQQQQQGQWQSQVWQQLTCGGGSSSSRAVSGICMPSPSKLDEVMKLEQLMGKTPEEVTDIWLEGHSDVTKNRVGSVMSAAEYQAFRARAKESPLFVLPLAKPGGGFLTMVSQCQMPFVLLTTLDEYKKHLDAAPAHMTVTLYPELIEAKGLALLRGDVVTEAIINPQEARLLLEVLRAFYAVDEDYELVRTFNHQPAKFDFAAVLKKMGHTDAPPS